MVHKLLQLKTAHANRRSYTLGLLQAQVYRLLKHQTKDILDPYRINTLEWSLLGLVYESKDEGVRAIALSGALLIDMPFVTLMVVKLEKRGFLKRSTDAEDKRAKRIIITTKGKSFVDAVETEVKIGIRPLLKGLSASELITYITVLTKFKNNAASAELLKPVKDVPKHWRE